MIATTSRTIVRSLPLSRIASVAAVLLGLGLIQAAPASAVVNSSVRSACMSDYFQFCAGMDVGSSELRRCFNRNGSKLSSSCVSALVSAGEVSQTEVSRRGGASKSVAMASKARSGKKIASRANRRQYATLR